VGEKCAAKGLLVRVSKANLQEGPVSATVVARVPSSYRFMALSDFQFVADASLPAFLPKQVGDHFRKCVVCLNGFARTKKVQPSKVSCMRSNVRDIVLSGSSRVLPNIARGIALVIVIFIAPTPTT